MKQGYQARIIQLIYNCQLYDYKNWEQRLGAMSYVGTLRGKENNCCVLTRKDDIDQIYADIRNFNFYKNSLICFKYQIK